MFNLSVICADGSKAVARFVVVQEHVGPVIETLASISPSSKADIHVHELPNAILSSPLLLYLDSLGLEGAPFDAAGQIVAAPEAVLLCYEIACGRIDVRGFVAEVDLEIVSMLDDGIEVPSVFRGNPRIEALRSNHNRLTRSAVRRAARDHAAIVIILDGGKRAVAAFNMNKSCGPGYFGGEGYLNWMLDFDSQLPLPTEGCNYVIYAGNTDPDMLRDPRNMKMDEPEFALECFLGSVILVGGEDVGRPDGVPLNMLAIDAIVGYEPTEVVYARDAAWRNTVWRPSPSV